MMRALDVDELDEQHRERRSVLLVALQPAPDRANPGGWSLLAANVADLDLRSRLRQRLGRLRRASSSRALAAISGSRVSVGRARDGRQARACSFDGALGRRARSGVGRCHRPRLTALRSTAQEHSDSTSEAPLPTVRCGSALSGRAIDQCQPVDGDRPPGSARIDRRRVRTAVAQLILQRLPQHPPQRLDRRHGRLGSGAPASAPAGSPETCPDRHPADHPLELASEPSARTACAHSAGASRASLQVPRRSAQRTARISAIAQRLASSSAIAEQGVHRRIGDRPRTQARMHVERITHRP